MEDIGKMALEARILELRPSPYLEILSMPPAKNPESCVVYGKQTGPPPPQLLSRLQLGSALNLAC